MCVRSQQHRILYEDLLPLSGRYVSSSVCHVETAPCISSCFIYVNPLSVKIKWLFSDIQIRICSGFLGVFFCQVRKIWMWFVTPAFST